MDAETQITPSPDLAVDVQIGVSPDLDPKAAKRARQRQNQRRFKEAHPDYYRDYRAANLEKAREYGRNHARKKRSDPEFREKQNERRRELYAHNPEPHLERTREWREDNREWISVYDAWRYAMDPEATVRWRAENPERYQEQNRQSNSRRKIKVEAQFLQEFDANRERERHWHLRYMAGKLHKSILTSGELPDHAVWECDLADLVGYVADHAPIVVTWDPFDDYESTSQ
jgi:hypothetical protein